jgi:hypothetical protein
MLICSHCNVDEVSIYAELHQGSEPLEGVRHHVRFSFDGSLHMEVIRVKNSVRLPLFSHITQVPERGELCIKWLEWINVWEGRIFWHFPSKKRDEDQEPSKTKFIALILCFAAVQFKLIN